MAVQCTWTWRARPLLASGTGFGVSKLSLTKVKTVNRYEIAFIHLLYFCILVVLVVVRVATGGAEHRTGDSAPDWQSALTWLGDCELTVHTTHRTGSDNGVGSVGYGMG